MISPTTVFDSQDVTAPYTQYVVKLRSSASSSSQTPKEGWKLRKRYSDFYALHQKLRRTRRQWEISCLKQGEAFQSVIKVLQQAAGPEFPRKHLRCDTSEIIRERSRQLVDFTRTLLAAYVELEVLLSAPGLMKGNFVDEIVCVNTVFVEIERFLEIPPRRKEIEAQLTRAVMTLEDVKSDPNSGVKASQCCICLNDSDPSGDSDGGVDTGSEMAQLPCAHIFHEDCIIHWLQCGSTCPMCRRTVGKAAKRREFLDDETKSLICIPCHSGSSSVHSSPLAASAPPSQVPAAVHQPLPTTPTSLLQVPPTSSSPIRTAESTKGERWTEDEHERFLLGMELFKAGPWKKIAGVVGTRDARQTMSHAQKYRQKIKRRKLGLPTPEPPRRDADGTQTTSTTKRMRTVSTIATEADVGDRVAGNTGSQQVSTRTQSPRGELDGSEQDLERATGLILAETLLAINTASSNTRTLDGVMVGTDNQGDRQLDATLEPLDINTDVSVVHDSWLGPDELWDFLDGRQDAVPDVAGVCAEAESEPRPRDARHQ
ncbi:Protein REVEILLE 8 [Phytophthora citrophthora]|uniref:Protein REVEILLE 8 n=1 Tax=Phytophthora citrophthora TaxID=4793 RepID=A0AAD9LQ42_9STRA|nr:Protein REVEILLE 8 [Phytophthora citrophthora]